MGRPKGSTKESSAAKIVEKSSRSTRDKPKKSYKEMDYSEDEYKSDNPTSPEEIPEADSGSDYNANSSGSEYGKKKKAPAKKSNRGRKPGGGKAAPAAKANLTPKKRGRKPKNASPAQASSNGNKRKRDVESSEDEDEKIPSSPSPSEDEMSDYGGNSSGSEYGSSKKKKGASKSPTRAQPKRVSGEAPKKRGRKPKNAPPPAANGSKKPKLEKSEDEKSEEEEEDMMETDNGLKIDENVVEKKEELKEQESDENEKSEEEEAKEAEDESEEEKKVEKEKEPLKNRTETDYKSIKLTCDRKNKSGESWNFKISCWNIGGVKAWIKKNGLEYLKAEDPDVMCLQETKCNDKTKPAEVKSLPNYPHAYWSYSEHSSGSNGVATFSKTKPESVSYGIPVEEGDSDEDKKFKEAFNKEGRLIVTEFPKFYLVNAYVPNGGRAAKDEKNPSSKPYPPKVTSGERQNWDRLLRTYVKALTVKKEVIVTGDLNVAHEPIDLANPGTNGSTAGFTKEEREGFGEFLKETSMVDTYRSLYPDGKDYSFWSYMNNSRSKNVGWRLDYFLVSDKLRETLCESTMRNEVYGSDHCPIVLFLHL